MTIIVERTEDGWRRFEGQPKTLTKMVSTCTIAYGDGRAETAPCDPYPTQVVVDPAAVARLVADGTWGGEELSELGLATAKPFDVPDGKRPVGAEFFVETKGDVVQRFEVEDAPAPPALSTADRVDQFLAGYGITRDELKSVLFDKVV